MNYPTDNPVQSSTQAVYKDWTMTDEEEYHSAVAALERLSPARSSALEVLSKLHLEMAQNPEHMLAIGAQFAEKLKPFTAYRESKRAMQAPRDYAEQSLADYRRR